MKAIVTVIGKDKVGIIAEVSSLLAEKKVNILDISQTILQNYFTMIMLVELDNISVSFQQLNDELLQKGEKLGVSIKMQLEDVFNSMNRI